jgi:hypothetical protein
MCLKTEKPTIYSVAHEIHKAPAHAQQAESSHFVFQFTDLEAYL